MSLKYSKTKLNPGSYEYLMEALRETAQPSHSIYNSQNADPYNPVFNFGVDTRNKLFEVLNVISDIEEINETGAIKLMVNLDRKNAEEIMVEYVAPNRNIFRLFGPLDIMNPKKPKLKVSKSSTLSGMFRETYAPILTGMAATGSVYGGDLGDTTWSGSTIRLRTYDEELEIPTPVPSSPAPTEAVATVTSINNTTGTLTISSTGNDLVGSEERYNYRMYWGGSSEPNTVFVSPNTYEQLAMELETATPYIPTVNGGISELQELANRSDALLSERAEFDARLAQANQDLIASLDDEDESTDW